jgi:hypothetical protein
LLWERTLGFMTRPEGGTSRDFSEKSEESLFFCPRNSMVCRYIGSVVNSGGD